MPPGNSSRSVSAEFRMVWTYDLATSSIVPSPCDIAAMRAWVWSTSSLFVLMLELPHVSEV